LEDKIDEMELTIMGKKGKIALLKSLISDNNELKIGRKCKVESGFNDE